MCCLEAQGPKVRSVVQVLKKEGVSNKTNSVSPWLLVSQVSSLQDLAKLTAGVFTAVGSTVAEK